MAISTHAPLATLALDLTQLSWGSGMCDLLQGPEASPPASRQPCRSASECQSPDEEAAHVTTNTVGLPSHCATRAHWAVQLSLGDVGRARSVEQMVELAFSDS